MNKDSKLIFESYINSKDELFLEAWYDDFRDWDWKALAEVGKVLDPTGVSSWGDFFRSVGEYAKEPHNPMKMAMVVLNAYCCIPNLGLLAGGVGGIGWAALRGAAKKAASDPKAAITISEKILKFMSKSPKIAGAFDKVLQNAVNKKLIDKEAKEQLMHVVKTGKIDNIAHGENLQKIVNKVNPLKTGDKEGEALGAYDMFKAGWKPEKGIGHAVFGNTVSVPPYIKGVDIPFAGAGKGAVRTAKGIDNYFNQEEDRPSNTPSYPTFSKSRWEQANPGETFPKQVGDTFLNGKTGQVMIVVEQADKTDTGLKLNEILPTPEKLDTEKTTPPIKPLKDAIKAKNDEVKKTETTADPTSTTPKTTTDSGITIGNPNAEPYKSDVKVDIPKDLQAPTQTNKPTDDTYKKDYQGVSIVEFLNQSGKPSDFASRKELAQKMGIPNYTGTASQNLLMLNTLRSGKTEVPVKQATPSYTSNYMGPAKTAAPKPTDVLPKTGTPGKEVSTHFVRVGPGNYRPAVQADITSKQQLFIRNPNPAARLVYPFIKAQNAPVRRANL